MIRGHRELRFEDWPALYRAAWAALFLPGDFINGEGEAVHWGPATRKTNLKHFSRWLAWLRGRGELDPNLAPGALVTPTRVKAYACSMMEQIRPRTVASALIGLKCVMIRLHPETDWTWLREITNRLDAWADANTPPKQQLPSADIIWPGVRAALEDLRGRDLRSNADLLAVRDTVMIALLVHVPIRLRNLTMMRIGVHYRDSQGGAWLRFAPDETKTRVPIDMPVAEDVAVLMRWYLAEIRPRIRGAAATDRVWVGNKAAPMAENTIYQRIRARCVELFDEELSPHDFRSIVATFLAESSTADALRARPLLSHVLPGTTERHYVRARQIEASRAVHDALGRVRDAGSGDQL